MISHGMTLSSIFLLGHGVMFENEFHLKKINSKIKTNLESEVSLQFSQRINFLSSIRSSCMVLKSMN